MRIIANITRSETLLHGDGLHLDYGRLVGTIKFSCFHLFVILIKVKQKVCTPSLTTNNKKDVD